MASADSYEKSPGLKKSALKYGPYSKNPVVATAAGPSTTGAVQAPKATFNINPSASNAQTIRASDVYGANNYSTPWADAKAAAKAISDAALGQPSAFQSGLSGVGGSGGSGVAAPKYSDRTDRMKVEESKRQFDITSALDQAQFDLTKANTAQGRADAAAKYQALQDYYNSGDWKTGYNDLENIAIGQYNTGVEGLQGTYDRAQTNLGAGYDLAQGLTDQGYASLQKYLQQNPNNAFAGLQQQVQPVANPMEQFLSAYGVSNQPVQAQIAAEQLAGQQGAGAFNSLADILNRNAQQSDASRLAEMQMAQTMANSGLGAQRANYGAQNAQAQAQALAQLQQQLSGQQFGIQQNQMQAGQDIYNQILAATGNYGATGGGSDTGTEPIMNLPNFNPGAVNQNTGLSPEALQAMEARRGMGIGSVPAVVQPPVVQNSGFSPEALQAMLARRGM